MKKLIVIVLALLMFTVFAIPATAHAAAPTGNALVGVNITIVCPTTPATGHGRRGNNSYFVAADGRTLGVMSAADASAIRDRFAVTDANGNWLPPGSWPVLTGMEWSKWFAAEFNALRVQTNAQQAPASPIAPIVPTSPEPMAPAGIRFTPEWIEAERAELIRLVNAERERAGMHRLEVCDDLMDFAMTRVRELGVTGLTHVRPNGVRVDNEVATRANAADRAVRRWMDSPPHRRAMLGEDAFSVWTRFGVAVYRHGAVIVFER